MMSKQITTQAKSFICFYTILQPIRVMMKPSRAKTFPLTPDKFFWKGIAPWLTRSSNYIFLLIFISLIKMILWIFFPISWIPKKIIQFRYTRHLKEHNMINRWCFPFKISFHFFSNNNSRIIFNDLSNIKSNIAHYFINTKHITY